MDFFTGPDTRAAQAAVEVCTEFAEPWLRNHSLRAYSWAVAYGASAGITDYDDELLYVAALMHDLALTPFFDSHRIAFEEAGGRLAKVFAAGAGWDSARRERLNEVIVLHMRDDVPPEQDVESHLLQIAVSADVSGRRLELFTPEFTEELLGRYPRLGFAEKFLDQARDQATRKPDCAAADLMRSGWPDRVLNNKLD
ncbi:MULTISPECIES: HD domain-containing protein [unclassified Saccharothrix]|uniref:HD domain-containing protein n=1 Tax=unclassified Saccharothrix TaxID=2593673 RepID=UPI00307F096F